MSRSEKAEQNDALVGLTALSGSFFYRSNTGQAWQGQRLTRAPGATVTVEPGMVILRNARPITFGVPGLGDVSGVYRGMPAIVEMKTVTGPQRITQKNFESAWLRAGGCYILARSADEAVSILLQKRRTFTLTQ